MTDVLKRYSSRPKVFVLESENVYKKDDIVNYTTKYGKEIELRVFKFMFTGKNGLNYYSYAREDGLNRNEFLKNKIEKRQKWADSSNNKSNEYYEKSQEGKDFLSLGEPIKVGHHSEKRHRALIDRNWARMRKSLEYADNAASHLETMKNIEYQLKRELPIDHPDCMEDIQLALCNAKELHLFYKENPKKRSHSYSLSYAKKKVNELERRLSLAKELWCEEC